LYAWFACPFTHPFGARLLFISVTRLPPFLPATVPRAGAGSHLPVTDLPRSCWFFFTRFALSTHPTRYRLVPAVRGCYLRARLCRVLIVLFAVYLALRTCYGCTVYLPAVLVCVPCDLPSALPHTYVPGCPLRVLVLTLPLHRFGWLTPVPHIRRYTCDRTHYPRHTLPTHDTRLPAHIWPHRCRSQYPLTLPHCICYSHVPRSPRYLYCVHALPFGRADLFTVMVWFVVPSAFAFWTIGLFFWFYFHYCVLRPTPSLYEPWLDIRSITFPLVPYFAFGLPGRFGSILPGLLRVLYGLNFPRGLPATHVLDSSVC